MLGDSIFAGPREAKQEIERCFPDIKLIDFIYYLVPLLTKKRDSIIIHIGINDAPYNNEDDI